MNRAAAIVLCLALMSLATARGAAPAVDYAKDIKPLLRDSQAALQDGFRVHGVLKSVAAEVVEHPVLRTTDPARSVAGSSAGPLVPPELVTGEVPALGDPLAEA